MKLANRWSLLAATLLLTLLSCVPDRQLDSIWESQPSSKQILITSPAEGDTLSIANYSYPVRWAYRGKDNSSDFLEFFIYHDDSLLGKFDTVYDIGYYLNTTFYPGKYYIGDSELYRIVCKDKNNSFIADTSGYFSIISPYNGGYEVSATVIEGPSYDTVSATWTTTGFPGNYVQIDLYKDSLPYFNVTTDYDDEGSCKWAISKKNFLASSSYQLKITSMDDPSLSALSNSFAINGTLKPDTFEVDNTPDNASTIEIGGIQDRSLYRGDVDWVKLSVEAGKKYRIKQQGSSYLAIVLYENDAVTKIDSTKSSSSYKELFFTADSTDTLYAKVVYTYSSSSFYDIDYDLYFDEYDPDKSFSFTTISSEDTLVGGESKMITWKNLTSTSYSYSYMDLDLFVDTTLLYSIQEDIYYSSSTTWTVPTWLESGTYRLRISANDTTYGFSDTFTVIAAVPDSYEPNDSSFRATSALPFNSTKSSNLLVADKDWYSLPVDSGTIYGFKITATNAVVATLYEKSSLVISRDTISAETETISFTRTTPDTVYLLIDAGLSNKSALFGGNYTVTAVQASSDSLGTVTSPDSSSLLAVNTTANLTWDAPLIGQSVKIALLKDSVHFLTLASATVNDGLFEWSLPNGIPSGTNYQISVRNYSDSNQVVLSTPFSISGVVHDTFEIDNDDSQANEITEFGVADSHTIIIGDTDWVKITTEPEYHYTVSVTSDFPSTITAYTMVPMKSVESFSGNSTTYHTYYSDTLDSLFLMIRSSSTLNGGSYSIVVDRMHRDSLISIQNPTATSVFAHGQSYVIKWKAPTLSANVRLSLFKGDTFVRQIYYGTPNDGVYSWSVTKGLPSGNDYRIKVADYSDTSLYQFSDSFSIAGIIEDSYEPDNSFGTTTLLVPGDTVPQYHSLALNDTDMVKVTLKKDSLYAFCGEFDSLPSKVKFSLYDATDSSLVVDSISDTLPWICTQSGDYYLSVVGNNSYCVNEYALSVKEFGSSYYTINVQTTYNTDNTALTLTWNGVEFSGNNVDIFLFQNGVIHSSIVTLLSANGTYFWNIPGTIPAGDAYSVKVISRWNSIVQGESEPFSIQ